MPVVSFPWDAQLVSIRRDTVPQAEWDNATHAWLMSQAEAETFLHAAQARMYFARFKCTVTVDSTVWVLGFAPNTPYQLEPPGRTVQPNRRPPLV